nr:hypothetical protein GCM10025699_26030 [Microbacterium flavescens]
MESPLIGVPDHGRDDDDEQQRAHDRPPEPRPGAVEPDESQTEDAVARPPCSVGMKTIWIPAKIARMASGSQPKKPEIR